MIRFLGPAILIAVAVNILLGAVHIWGRGGQTTIVDIESQGGAYRALVDGRVALPHLAPDKGVVLNAPAAGTVVLTFSRGIPSLGRPSGVDSIVVTDGGVTELLFKDDFSDLNGGDWEVLSGSFSLEDGVLVAREEGRPSTILLRRKGWTDYRVQVTFRNVMAATVGTHVDDHGGVYYNFNLVRDFPNFFDVFKDGERTAQVYGGFVHTSQDQVLRSIAWMTTTSVPLVFFALAAGVVAALALGLLEGILPEIALPPWSTRLPIAALSGLVIGVLAVVAFGATLYINREYYSFLPHVPDEVAYMFQAKLLAAGHLTAPAPPVREAFQFYNPPFVYENGDRWASFYPFGHPVVLAIGALFGVMWVVPSFIGAACVALIYAVGQRLYDSRTGLVAALLLAASPFFLMQASSFMSHSTGAFYVLLSLLFILKRDRPLLYGFVAGLAFGLLANTRPLTAIALVPPFGVLLLSYVVPREGRSIAVKHTLAFVAGGLLMALAFLAYNYGLTGDPLTSPYADNEGATVGFVNGHTLNVGLRNEQAQLMALLLVLNGWPVYVGLAFVILPFVLGTGNRWDYFCLASALIPVAAYVFYRFSGVYEGPRYWYEVTPFFFLLSARGAECAARFISAAAGGLRRQLFGTTRPASWAGAVVVYAMLVYLVVNGTGGWLFGWNDHWLEPEAPLVPQKASAIVGVFGVDDRLAKLADETKLENALVLVKPCGFFNSQHCYGSVFLRNSLDFDGDVVWARYIAERNAEIIAAFPGRAVYVANWDDKPSLEPYSAEPGR